MATDRFSISCPISGHVTGQARDIRLLRSLAFGLDEKAVEAVREWKFQPGYRDGQPVAVQAVIEVNFRLL